MSMIGRTNNVPKLTERRVPRLEPVLQTGDVLEADLNAKVEEIKQYAPPLHPDRISATTQIMTAAIGKVAEDAAARIDARVAELEQRVDEIKKGAVIFKEGLTKAAEALSRQVELAMAQYEDITSKMQESPFGAKPAPAAPAEPKPEPVPAPPESPPAA